jgi:SAM-dependent methyltransferase
MMKCDASWLAQTLRRYSDDELTPLVNLGASTEHFRTVEQPHIDRLVFAPLLARGLRIIHTDFKVGRGVDIAGDIFDDATFSALKATSPRAIICTHMLEHVTDRERLVARMLDLLPRGGLFFVTVPSSYHLHNDPIDTMFRPTPKELAALFVGHQILESVELTGDTYWSLIRKRPLTLIGRHLGRFFIPFFGWRQWKRSMAKLYWLFHHYKVAALVGRKS